MRVSENTYERLILDDVPWIRGILIILITVITATMAFREINEGHETGYLILAFALIVGPIFFALFIERYQVVFLRRDGVILRRKRSVFGASETTHELSRVSHAEIVESRDSDGGRMYHPVLVVRDGPDFPGLRLVDYYTTGWGPPQLTETVNNWLGVDPEAGFGD